MTEQANQYLPRNEFVKRAGITSGVLTKAENAGHISSVILNGRKHYRPEDISVFLRPDYVIPDNELNRLLKLARIRKEEASAAREELRYEQEVGNLLDAEHVKNQVTDIVLKFRQRIQSIPSRTALQLAEMSNPKEIEMFLESVLREACEELARDGNPTSPVPGTSNG